MTGGSLTGDSGWRKTSSRVTRDPCPVSDRRPGRGAQEIVVKKYVNLGIAAATPHGLMVPNIKDADQMSLLQLANAMANLISTAREGRTLQQVTAPRGTCNRKYLPLARRTPRRPRNPRLTN